MASRAILIDGQGNTVAVLPTWSDGAIAARILGLRCDEMATAHPLDMEPEAEERIVARWPNITDRGWRACVARLRGEECAAAWHAVHHTAHPTPEARSEAEAQVRARFA